MGTSKNRVHLPYRRELRASDSTVDSTVDVALANSLEICSCKCVFSSFFVALEGRLFFHAPCVRLFKSAVTLQTLVGTCKKCPTTQLINAL